MYLGVQIKYDEMKTNLKIKEYNEVMEDDFNFVANKSEENNETSYTNEMTHHNEILERFMNLEASPNTSNNFFINSSKEILQSKDEPANSTKLLGSVEPVDLDRNIVTNATRSPNTGTMQHFVDTNTHKIFSGSNHITTTNKNEETYNLTTATLGSPTQSSGIVMMNIHEKLKPFGKTIDSIKKN